MRTVTLLNRRGAMLPPIHVPELGLVEHIVGTNDRDAKTGNVGRRKTVQSLPQTITLCARGTPGDRVQGLPEGAASSPEVLAAKARGDIDVSISDDVPAPEAVKPEAVTKSSKSSKSPDPNVEK